jgi:hypothetical protein
MSHFTRIKTKIAEKEHLLSALESMGYPYEDGGSEVRGYGGRRVNAEIRVKPKSGGYDIGFYKNGDHYEIVADWYGIHGIKQQEFVEKLHQLYAYHTTKAKLETQGFTLVSEENEQDGRIHLLVRRMA